jgi:hypothetical protein
MLLYVPYLALHVMLSRVLDTNIVFEGMLAYHIAIHNRLNVHSYLLMEN